MTTVEELVKNETIFSLKFLDRKWKVKYVSAKTKAELEEDILTLMEYYEKPPEEKKKKIKYKKCSHGKRIHYCRESGGKYICIHDKQKFFVKNVEVRKFANTAAIRQHAQSARWKEE